MNAESVDILQEKLCNIFRYIEDKSYYDHRYIEISKLGDSLLGQNNFEIKVGAMYEPPTVNFEILKKLSELFGTVKIDLDNFAEGGCETCDHGSDYGHTIQIYAPTLYVEEMEQLVGKDLFQ